MKKNLFAKSIGVSFLTIQASIAYAAFYVDLGAGGVFSDTHSSANNNSSYILYAPTSLGSSIFRLPNVNWKSQFKNGYDVGASFGYAFTSHWRSDLEFLYQNIKRETSGSYGWEERYAMTGVIYAQQSNNPISTVSTRAKMSSFMTNVAYDFANQSKWTPFLGGGIGLSCLSSSSTQSNNPLNIDDPNTPLVESTSARQHSPRLYGTAFAGQIKAGLIYAFSESKSLALQYRLLGTSHFQAEKSLITTNPGLPGESNFFITPFNTAQIITQAVELRFRILL